MWTGDAAGGLSALHGSYWLGYLDWSYATRDAIWMHSNYVDLIECLSYGPLWSGSAHCGVSCLNGDPWIGFTGWTIATIYTKPTKTL